MLRSLLRGALFDYIFLKDFCISILLSAIDYKEISEFESCQINQHLLASILWAGTRVYINNSDRNRYEIP
jgi:hypothetical protein